MDRLLLATSNPGKVREMRALLQPVGITIVTPEEAGVDITVEETGATFAENARLKAEGYSSVSGLAAVADDSGLVVDALSGEPGVYSARFGGPGLDDAGRVALLLERMRDVPEGSRSARFVCAVALTLPGQRTEVFEGVAEGVITQEPRGKEGFGYDPVFLYPPIGRTFAELELPEKDEVSHRGQALRKLVDAVRGPRADDILVQPNNRLGGS